MRIKGEGAAGNMLIAYFSTMGIHGLYDFVLSIDDTSVILCILVLILSVVLMFLLISHAAKNDHIIAVNPIWVIRITSDIYLCVVQSAK